MSTPIYVKMDAREPLLLSEGVCRQLGIVSYHQDVEPREPSKSIQGLQASPESVACVLTMRIKLVQSVRVLPNQSLLTEARLSDQSGCNGPMIIESNETHERARVTSC